MRQLPPILAAGVLVLIPSYSSRAQDSVERRPPRALLAFREARRQIVSGRIGWNVSLPDSARTMRFVSRYAANGDLIFENRGDEDGWVWFDQSGRGLSRYPHLYLTTPEGVWEYRETTPHATVWPPGSPELSRKPDIKDARAIGIFSTSESIERPLASRGAWESTSDPVVSYEERREGDAVIVRGEHRSGSITEWTLAPDKGWNAVRIESEGSNGTCTSVENELRKFGDVWLPEEAVYRRNGLVEAIVKVEDASLNRPEDPREFTPNDIGLEPGIHVASQTAPLGSRIQIWNGEEISEADRYHREVKEGLRMPGKVFREINEKGYFDSPYQTAEEKRLSRLDAAKQVAHEELRSYQTMWREYVESFIKRYNLNDDQQQKARAVLAECEQRAEPIAKKAESRWNEIRLQLEEAVRGGENEKAKRLRDERDKLNEPIRNIFTTRLAPALETLPTRAQRKAAAAAGKAAEPD